MPTYLHQCSDDTCNHEFEEFYSITKIPPTHCDKCGQETIKRVINSKTIGVVELTNKDLLNKLKQDGKNLQREASRNENTYANLLGTDKYQSLQTRLDKQKK